MWTRAELKDNAKKFFKYNYWKMVLVTFILTMFGGGGGSGASISYTRNYNFDSSTVRPAELMGYMTIFFTAFMIIMIFALALSIFLFNPLQIGAQRFFVVSHYQKAKLDELGYAFSNGYMNVVKTMFLKGLFTSLWTLLFIIPGIIKGYEYRMIPYILAENPGIDSSEAFAISKKMMDGNKWKAFVLDLSFLGWSILSIFTCGILAIFYVNPYIYMTDAELYVALKEITFGRYNQNYQYDQVYQNSQNFQNDQMYQNSQGYQNGQTYQNNQGYHSGQTYQNNQSYQNSQGYQNSQTYQNDQNYQDYQN